MKEETCKAIVLRAIPYQERSKILTIFSESKGILSMIMSHMSAQKHAIATPFCEAEFVFLKKQSDMVSFKEGKILDDHMFLRTRLDSLQSASSMTKAILSSQMPGKSSPLLYQLLKSYLHQLPFFPVHHTLLASYYLKILQHEGVFVDQNYFNQDEFEGIQKLSEIRKFKEIETCAVSESLLEKIKLYFEDQTR